jgi:hypothetical protein
MAVKSEVAIEGDSKGFNAVGKWYCGAYNADASKGRISSKFLPGAESNCFRLTTVEYETIVGEPSVECGEAKL